MRFSLSGRGGALAAALLLGAAAGLITLGPRVLDPTNVAWLVGREPSSMFLGWHFFRHAAWSFPLGLNPTYGLEISSAIVYSDSNPLLALLLKPFAALLPEPFQYFGWWLYACFALQALMAWKLTGLITTSPAHRFLATGLFVFAPPMIWRMHEHFSLAGHFLVLAALHLSLRPGQRNRAPLWAVVLVAAALIHAYLLAMVAALWIANLIQLVVSKDLSPRRSAVEVVGIVLAVGLASWQAGYFSVGAGASAAGFGHYRMNVLSIVDPSGWSYVLPDLPEAAGEYEGFNFAGLGVIILFLFALPLALRRRTGLIAAAAKRPALLLTIVALALFAVSNQIGLGTTQFELPVPERLLQIANVFRSSGRMFWPAFYTILLAIVFVVVRSLDRRQATCLLAVALAVQVADTSAGWRHIRRDLMANRATEWATPLTDPFWAAAGARYRKIRHVPTERHPVRDWQVVAAYAARYGMATDVVYVNRVSEPKYQAARAKTLAALDAGRYEPDSLYVLDAGLVPDAVLHLDRSSDLLARIDGMNVVAPGWRRCQTCPQVADELRVADLFTPIRIGERITFSATGSGARYLGRGWSQPEAWGIWSDGETATLVLPLGTTEVGTIVIESNALVVAGHPHQTVEVRLNGELAASVRLAEPSANRITVPVPAAARAALARNGYVHLELRLPDSVRPADIGISADPRRLGIGLVAITAT